MRILVGRVEPAGCTARQRHSPASKEALCSPPQVGDTELVTARALVVDGYWYGVRVLLALAEPLERGYPLLGVVSTLLLPRWRHSPPKIERMLKNCNSGCSDGFAVAEAPAVEAFCSARNASRPLRSQHTRWPQWPRCSLLVARCSASISRWIFRDGLKRDRQKRGETELEPACAICPALNNTQRRAG
jgi:hypothetical protein